MLRMFLPIALVVASNCFYNITTKKTPENANAFLSLAVTYGVAAIVSFIIFIIGYRDTSLSAELKKLNWTAFALGVIIIGLELGYILIYRAGWDVSRAPLVANCCLAIALIFIGMIFFKEKITVKQTIGIVISLIGMVIVTV